MSRDSFLWKREHPYGLITNPIHGLCATVAMQRRGKKTSHAAYVSFHHLTVQQRGFSTARDGQVWCEMWLKHFVRFQQMEQEVA